VSFFIFCNTAVEMAYKKLIIGSNRLMIVEEPGTRSDKREEDISRIAVKSEMMCYTLST
jgi:hypothetical protein